MKMDLSINVHTISVLKTMYAMTSLTVEVLITSITK